MGTTGVGSFSWQYSIHPEKRLRFEKMIGTSSLIHGYLALKPDNGRFPIRIPFLCGPFSGSMFLSRECIGSTAIVSWVLAGAM